MSSPSIPKKHPYGSDIIITKSDISLFTIIATFSAIHLYDSNIITWVSSLL